MLIDDSTKNDIIKILEELLDDGVPGAVYDYDPEWEYRYCRICYGHSHNLLNHDDIWAIPENRIVKHEEDCVVLLARKLLPIFKGDNNGTDGIQAK